MDKDASITFRLPRALKDAAERAAERDSRSIGQFLNVLLARHLETTGDWRGGVASNRRGRKTKPVRR